MFRGTPCTSLLGHFAPIFYLNCENVLFMYNVKQNKKSSQISTKNFVDFQNFQKFNVDRILMEGNIRSFDHSLTFPGATQNWADHTLKLSKFLGSL